VYWASFQCEDTYEPVDGEHVTVPDLVRLPDGAGWIAAGRGLRAWPSLADRCRAAGATILDDLLPRASEVLALARPKVAAGQTLDPALALPVYVRDNVAAAPSS
jgi:tRNA threonylcarbamoyladenosine biosynthesis protein TsaB